MAICLYPVELIKYSLALAKPTTELFPLILKMGDTANECTNWDQNSHAYGIQADQFNQQTLRPTMSSDTLTRHNPAPFWGRGKRTCHVYNQYSFNRGIASS